MIKKVDVKFCDCCGAQEDSNVISVGTLSTGFYHVQSKDLCNKCYHLVLNKVMHYIDEETFNKAFASVQMDGVHVHVPGFFGNQIT